ncbi:MAG: hypothetical protein IJ400_01535 [Clostridia bacterium]|nr:hypothetical protein [Clostridia bacterium]
MILILDNNSFRREELKAKLTKIGYIVSCRPLDDYKSYAYPVLTVIVNPKERDISNYICVSNTKYIVAKDNFTDKTSRFTTIPHSSNLAENIALEFDKLKLNEKATIYKLGIACYSENEYSIGGKTLSLYPMERRIFKFFLHNPTKTFLDVDACDYFPFNSVPEENLKSTIWKINTKCNKARRPQLIEIYMGSYRLNPRIYNYDERLIEDLLPFTKFKNE